MSYGFSGGASRGTQRPPRNTTPRREVFPNAQVRHIFAQGEGRTARSGNGNIRCEGDILYSYRTPVAAFCPAPNGARVVILTSESYSVTTSQHVPREYDFHGTPVFRAPFFPRGDIGHGGNYVGQYAMPRELPGAPTLESTPAFNDSDAWARYDEARGAHRVASAHAGNLARFESDARENAAKLAKDRAYSSAARVAEHARHAARYCELFALALPAWASDGAAEMIAAAERERAALIARRESPANARKREREAQRRALAEGYAERAREVFREVMGRDVRTDYRGRIRPDDSDFRRLAASVTDDSKLAALADRIRATYAREIRERAESIARAREIAAREESEARAQFPTVEAARAALADYITRLSTPDVPRLAEAVARAYPELRESWREMVAQEKRERAARMEAQRAAEREAYAARLRALEAEKLARYPTESDARAAWRASGDTGGFSLWPNAAQSEHGGDMVRATESELITARGARAPLAEARRAFRFIAMLREAGRLPFPPREGATESVHAGAFTLHSVTREGAARFGCHVFAWQEMAQLAAELDSRDGGVPETVSGAA